MMTFKCKMCGGELAIRPGETVAVCEYCGTKQTLPKLDDDKRANLYERANHFRRLNEFDKAMGFYEHILEEDKSDAEAYWSIVLCRYGIEYVEDPKDHRRVPTVNRAQLTSIFADKDYQSALSYADPAQKEIYEAEAKAIDEIQKGILSISQKEEPFDIFICYKESDNLGNRTEDSVYAQDLYQKLTKEGYRVFFSRITLEDKLGSAYEPYIFAALHSSKVMIALGTKPEYFNAVWVKNEWNRYLALINAGEEKTLIPVYKDMDPYDLPPEFAYIQAQDMAKIGFMQDLRHGIEKHVKKGEIERQNNTSAEEQLVDTMLKKAYAAIESGDFKTAENGINFALGYDAKNVKGLLGRLLIQAKVKNISDLAESDLTLEGNEDFEAACKAADPDTKKVLEELLLEQKYTVAVNKMSFAKKPGEWKNLSESFVGLGSYKDSLNNAEICRKKEKERKKTKKTIIIALAGAVSIAVVVTGLFLLWRYVIVPNQVKDVVAKSGSYEQGYTFLKENGREDLLDWLKQEEAVDLLNHGEYDAAYSILESLNKGEEVLENKYNRAKEYLANKQYKKAIPLLRDLQYKDSADLLQQTLQGNSLLTLGNVVAVGDVVSFGHYEQDNDTSNGKEPVEWQVVDKNDSKMLLISKYILDCQPVNESRIPVTWQTCSLRKWLNESFFNDAFGSLEQEFIQDTGFYSQSGTGKKDKVFLLSKSSAGTYFPAYSSRICEVTAYCNASGAFSSHGKGLWWLMPYGEPNVNCNAVYYTGSDADYIVDHSTIGVRPAIWVSLE